MTQESSEYYHYEYFEEYYSNGLFHPTEAQNLLPHNKIILNNEKEYLQIGEIYDDHNLILCYRKGRDGIWGRSNFDGSYQLLSKTIKEFTEGWYQREPNYWRAMNQKTIWNEIANYYILNIERYNWKFYKLLNFLERGKLNQISDELFVKAYKNCVGISLNNGFISRPFENMVHLYFNEQADEYTAHFQLSFFTEQSSSKYKINQIDEMIESIRNWINKSV